jgi:formate dehydrogenase subunit delta
VDVKRLIAMANQIGAFFRAQGEAAAAAGVEDHLRRFWDPRMRREIVAHLGGGGEGLDPPVRAAVARLAETHREAPNQAL